MQIKFKAPDPRAGMVAQMDSSRGQQLIDAGAAVQVKDDGAEEKATPVVEAAVTAPAKPANKAKK